MRRWLGKGRHRLTIMHSMLAASGGMSAQPLWSDLFNFNFNVIFELSSEVPFVDARLILGHLQYCEFGGTTEKCREWLEAKHPEMFERVYGSGKLPIPFLYTR